MKGALLAAAGAVFLAGAGTMALLRPALEPAPQARAEARAAARPVARAAPVAAAEGDPSLAPLVERVSGAVVGVVARRQAGGEGPAEMREFWRRFFGGEPPGPFGGPEQRGLGSGFIIDPQGLVLTNFHVVEGAEEVVVRTADDREHPAEVRGTDPATDVALLQIRDLEAPLPSVELGSSDDLRVGDFVVAIGNPFGLSLTVTSGIISAKARVIGAGPYDDFLQTDAAINPGNSGGPLFDLDGKVVGINTAIVAAGQGIGFAVPIELVKSLLPQLEQKGRVVRGYIGVGVQNLTPELARELGAKVEKGALVASVEPEGPAAKAGLQPGDVVVSLEGQPVESASELSRTVATLPPGRRARLEVVRDGERRTVQVELVERPGTADRLGGGPQEPAPKPDALGLALQAVPPQVARQLGVEGGAWVAEVAPGSRAERAGLQPGDILVEANRKPVKSPDEVAAIAKERGGKALSVRVLRGEGALFLVIPPESRQ